ncbi:MAG: helix-turn-helix domain-containing protein [Microcoleaceae cyanobacterium]
MTHSEIADIIGTTRVSVTRMMQRDRKSGLYFTSPSSLCYSKKLTN